METVRGRTPRATPKYCKRGWREPRRREHTVDNVKQTPKVKRVESFMVERNVQH